MISGQDYYSIHIYWLHLIPESALILLDAMPSLPPQQPQSASYRFPKTAIRDQWGNIKSPAYCCGGRRDSSRYQVLSDSR